MFGWWRFLPWKVGLRWSKGVFYMFTQDFLQPWKELRLCRCCFARCLAKVCKKLLQLGAFCSRGPLQSRTALPWPEAAVKRRCSWTLADAWPKWFSSWHRCSTCNETLAPFIAGRMSWDYWNDPAEWSWQQLCVVALPSGLWWQCCGWCPPCYRCTSQPNISSGTAHLSSCLLPWGNCSCSRSTPLKVKSKKTNTQCLGGLGCMASFTLCHTLSWPDSCHTICAAAETGAHGRHPHRRYTIATLGSVAVTTHGKLQSCSAARCSYRRWESCLVPEFQASAKQCGDV